MYRATLIAMQTSRMAASRALEYSAVERRRNDMGGLLGSSPTQRFLRRRALTGRRQRRGPHPLVGLRCSALRFLQPCAMW